MGDFGNLLVTSGVDHVYLNSIETILDVTINNTPQNCDLVINSATQSKVNIQRNQLPTCF